MTLKFNLTWKRVVGIVLVLAVTGGIVYAGRWSYQRLNAAAITFNYLAGAPENATESRAATIDKLIKDYQTAHPGK